MSDIEVFGMKRERKGPGTKEKGRVGFTAYLMTHLPSFNSLITPSIVPMHGPRLAGSLSTFVDSTIK